MNCAVILYMARTFSVLEQCTMIMNRVRRMDTAIYGLVRRADMLDAGRDVSQLSLSSFPSFLEEMKDAYGLLPDDLYIVFMFEPMHHVHVGGLKC